MKTSELTGAALDWAVAKCEGRKDNDFGWGWDNYKPSTDWAQGGPIIEREHVGMDFCGWGVWEAWDDKAMPAPRYKGSTPLVAAMRCYCCSKLGDEVDVPKELA